MDSLKRGAAGDGEPQRRRGAWSWHTLGLALVLGLVACGDQGGGGCGGCDTTPYPANGPAIQNSVQVRVSQHGLDFLEQSVEPLIGEFLEGGLNFCVPETGSPVPLCNARQCPSTGETGCELGLEIDSVNIEAIEPSSVQATIVLGGLDQEEDFLEVTLLSQCLVRLGSVDDQGVEASVVADLVTDPTTGDVTVSLNPDNISINFDQFDIDIDGVRFIDQFICEGVDFLAELGFVRELLFAAIQGELGGLIDGLTGDLLCQSCEDDAGCPAGTSCNGDGVCFNPGTEACVPLPLGLEGVFDLGGLLASVTPGIEAELAYQIKANGLAQSINGGILLGMRGGAYAEKAECVRAVPPPPLDPVPPSVILSGNERPDGVPFQLGVGVSKAFLDEALWAAYNSGGLCLSVGSATSDFISTGTFGALFPSMRDLTGPNAAPMILQVSPNLPPTMSFGAGTVDPDTGAIIDPLLTLVWNDLSIHFHAFFNERYVRLFTYNVDLQVPLSLAVTEEGLLPVIGDLSNAFVRVEARDAGLLTEAPEFLEGLLPSLINVALPLLGDSLASPIELPEIQGFQLVLDDGSLQGIENNTMLGIFANLALAPPADEPNPKPAARRRLDTRAEVVDVRLPPAYLTEPGAGLSEGARVRALMAARPAVTVQAEALDALGQPVEGAEYSFRLDGGMWSTFRRNPEWVVDDALLLLQGRHRLEVRARRAGAWDTLDATPVVVEVPIDFSAPELRLEPGKDGVLRLDARDSVTPRAELELAWRVNGGAWSGWRPAPEALDVAELAAGVDAEVVQVEVRVRDMAGLEATASGTFRTIAQATHGNVQRAESDDQGCECASVRPGAGRSTPWGLLGAVGLALGAVVARRRRRRDAVPVRGESRLTRWLGLSLALGALVVAAGCSEDDTGAKKAGQVAAGCPEEGCPAGERCIDGACAPDTIADGCGAGPACGADAVCVNNAECVDHACGDSEDCPLGQGCAEDDRGVRGCQDVPCDSDAACGGANCPEAAVCGDGGACVCEGFCADGCGEGQFCCQTDNACQTLPDPCADSACEPGFRPEVVSAASGDEATCAVTAGACTCVALDPIPEGDVGLYSDVVERDGVFWMSAYNRTYGDLMVGRITDGDAVEWTFLDGLPDDGPVTGQIDGPRGGVRVAGDNVGRFSSIDADALGRLHIAYRDDTNDALKYAIGTLEADGWSWSIVTLDDAGDTGYWTDVNVGADGTPAVAYMTRAVGLDDPSVPRGNAKLRWAQAADPNPAGPESWTWVDLEAVEVDYACEGGCSGGRKCRLDTNTCETSSAASACDPGCGDGQACFSGTCADIAATGGLSSLPPGAGLFARSARFSDGSVALVYYDSIGADLRYVAQQGGVWGEPVILAGRAEDGTDLTDAGRFAAIAIDADDNVHIAYQDAIADDLRYINLTEATDELVDDGVRLLGTGVSTSILGQDASIVIDDEGKVRIAYQDATRHQLLLARRQGPGAWDLIVLAGDGDQYSGSYGFYARQLWSGGQSVVTNFRYNRQVDPADNGVTVHRY